MLIEFSCPVCQAALAIKKQAVGAQVNCPKCQKLILLPSESPLPRHDPEKPPYVNGQAFEVSEVTQAICTSVAPYRRDLETKTDLLNDAVEMVKVRNERIKEIETLMLNTQSDLWALEVAFDDLKGNGGPKMERLEEEKRALEENKHRLKSRLTNMIAHSEHLDWNLRSYREFFRPDGDLGKQLDAIQDEMTRQTDALAAGSGTVAEAQEWLRTLTDRMVKCQTRLEEAERSRQEMEALVHASSEDMQRALDERNQWRKRAQELERQSEASREEMEKLGTRIAESDRLQEEWTQDRDTAKRLREEMEENLSLLRGRIEQERESHKTLLSEQEAKWAESENKKTTSLKRKLEKFRTELERSESKRIDILKTQQQLAEQNMRAEEELGAVKRELEEAQNRIEELEDNS